jgi:phosphatidylserine/phosphatidylglycerophosphate/cardiolipin synthase-like enzyme
MRGLGVGAGVYRCLVLALLVGCAAMRQGPPRVASPRDFALATPEPDDPDCSSFGSEALERRIDQRTHSRLRDGNAAELLVDGRASWARRDANLATAELIVLKTFIFTDDEAGRAVAETLKARAAGGAMVIVQYDLKGSIGSVREALSLYDATNSRSFLRHTRLMDELAEHGVHVVATNVPRHGRALAGWVGAREAAGGDVVQAPYSKIRS